MTDVTVTLADLRSVPAKTGTAAGFCARGARVWFARHGLDWSEFLRAGIAAETLEATGDPLALALVDHARKRHGQ